MAINAISNITINGTNTPFGGNIYSLDYEVGFGPQSSTMKFSLISPNGQYTISNADLSYSNVVKIVIGNRTFNMFLVGYNIEQTDRGNVCQLDFDDTSSQYLDKISILLNNEYWPQGNSLPQIIGLGDSYGKATVLGFNNVPESLFFIESPNVNQQNVLAVPKVYYSNSELAIALNQRVPCDKSVQNILLNSNFNNYRAEYMGTVRDVLQKVGQDLAFNFFWNENEQLQFIDLSQPIKITAPTISNQVRVANSSSLRGTFTYGTSTFFGRDGYAAQGFGISGPSWNFNLLNVPASYYGFNQNLNSITQQNTDSTFLNLLKLSRLSSKDLFMVSFMESMLANPKYFQPIYNSLATPFTLDKIKASTANNNNGSLAKLNELQFQVGSTDPTMAALEADDNTFKVIESWYDNYKNYGDSYGSIFWTSMDAGYHAGYHYDTDFSWYAATTLVSATDLATFFPSQANQTLSQFFSTQQLTNSIPNSNNTLGQILSQQNGYGIIIKRPSWNTNNNTDANALYGQFSPPISFSNNNMNTNGILTNSFYVIYENQNNTNLFQQILQSIQRPIVQNTYIVKGVQTNELPSYFTVPRVMQNQYIIPTYNNNIEKVNIIPIQIPEELVGLFAGGLNNAISAASQVLTQPYIGYGQTSPIQRQSITIAGSSIPAITVQQGLEKININTSDQGMFTVITLGNRAAQPITNSVTINTLENGLFVRAAPRYGIKYSEFSP